jgi:hypothetical protein
MRGEFRYYGLYSQWLPVSFMLAVGSNNISSERKGIEGKKAGNVIQSMSLYNAET